MIRLYKCYLCWYIFDEAIVRSGKHIYCKCGAQEFKAINPTWLNIFLYICFQKTHALKRIFGRD